MPAGLLALLALTGCTTSLTAFQAFRGDKPVALAAVDATGDHRIDLVFADAGSNALTVHQMGRWGDYGSTLTLALPAGSDPSAVVAGYLGHTTPDIVVANEGTGTLSLFTTPVVNGEQPAATYSLGAGAQPSALAIADVNGDGLQDLLVVVHQPTAGPTAGPFGNPAYHSCSVHGCVLVFLGTGAPVPATQGLGDLRYAEAIPVAASDSPVPDPRAIAVGDFTGDGIIDLAVANHGTGELVVIPGTGGGLFAAPGGYKHVPLPGADAVVSTSTQLSTHPAAVAGSDQAAGLAAYGAPAFLHFEQAPKTVTAPLVAYGGGVVWIDPLTGAVGQWTYHVPELTGRNGKPLVEKALIGTNAFLVGGLYRHRGVQAADDLSLDVAAANPRTGAELVSLSDMVWIGPSTVDLGTVRPGQAVRKTVTWAVVSRAATTLAPTVTIADPAFGLDTARCRTVRAGRSLCRVGISFSSKVAGAHALTFVVDSRKGTPFVNGLFEPPPTITVQATVAKGA